MLLKRRRKRQRESKRLSQQLPVGFAAAFVRLEEAANPHKSLAAAHKHGVRHVNCELVISRKSSAPPEWKERKKERER